MARPQTVSDEQIVEAALQCFLEHGPGVSTETISQQLGVSPQALLKRFGTKQELMIAALQLQTLASTIPQLTEGPDDRPMEIQLTELLNDMAVFFVEMARRMSVLRWSHADCKQLMSQHEEPPPLLDIRMLAGWFQRAAERGLIRRVDFPALAMMLLSALHGPAMLSDVLGRHPTGHSTSEYVNILTNMILSGLNHHPGPS